MDAELVHIDAAAEERLSVEAHREDVAAVVPVRFIVDLAELWEKGGNGKGNLRNSLDVPECGLVAILDADKEGESGSLFSQGCCAFPSLPLPSRFSKQGEQAPTLMRSTIL